MIQVQLQNSPEQCCPKASFIVCIVCCLVTCEDVAESMHLLTAFSMAFAPTGRPGSTPLPLTLHDGSEVDVWPVLGFVEGDIPWLEMVTNSIGHGAARACFRCALNGVYNWVAKTIRCGLVRQC